ncbi:MAG: type I-G CRISPR-associated protein Csb2 [Chloroflexia bacterium]
MSDVVVIKVELLSGRYHAHVWGESQFGMAGPEWPPSPWRLLRALASAWFSSEPRPSSEADRDALLEALGRSGPPEIWLPRASLHELRYYQPVRLGGGDRVLHHDFYAVPEGARFWFRFAVSLSAAQRDLLEKLLSRLRYFGRSESRARLRVAEWIEPPPGVRRVTARGDEHSGDNVLYRQVLCTKPDFRASDLWSVRDGANPSGGYPPHLVDVLLARRMPLPDGARWVEYALPRELLVAEIRPRVKPLDPQPDIKVAEIRFRLSRRTPIPLQALIPLARAFRDAAVARHGELSGMHSLTLTGRQPDGSVSRGHRHAYYLPRLSPGRPTIDSLIVRIPTGRLSRAELDALLAVEHIRVDGSAYPVTVVPEEIVPELPPRQRATRWVSITPFIPHIHMRGRGLGPQAEEQLAVCLKRLGKTSPVSVERLSGPAGLGGVSSLLAHEYRQDESDRAERRWAFTRRLGFWLRLTFDEPVLLDVPIGADAHFGAGQFRCC